MAMVDVSYYRKGYDSKIPLHQYMTLSSNPDIPSPTDLESRPLKMRGGSR